MRLPAAFDRYRAEIDAELKAVLAGWQLPLYDMMRYHLGWVDERGGPLPNSSGKAIRPTLCLLACEAVGGKYRKAMPAAAAIELVHNYSLILDDVQDDDSERRHRPTVWSIWGKPQAINAGTAMRLLANRALLRLRQRNIALRKLSRIQYLIDNSSLELIEGQYLDISYENRFDIGVNDYLNMIERKTGSLIACSLEVGALIGTEEEPLIQGLKDVGRNLGLAFQIKDDILGIWGKEEETGKPLRNDIRRKKKTFPIVYALEKTRAGVRTKLASIYLNGSLSETGLASVMEILEAVEARAGAQNVVGDYCWRAKQAMSRLELAPVAKQDLEDLLDFLVERNF